LLWFNSQKRNLKCTIAVFVRGVFVFRAQAILPIQILTVSQSTAYIFASKYLVILMTLALKNIQWTKVLPNILFFFKFFN